MTKERTMVEEDGEKCRKLKNSSGYILEDCNCSNAPLTARVNCQI